MRRDMRNRNNKGDVLKSYQICNNRSFYFNNNHFRTFDI